MLVDRYLISYLTFLSYFPSDLLFLKELSQVTPPWAGSSRGFSELPGGISIKRICYLWCCASQIYKRNLIETQKGGHSPPCQNDIVRLFHFLPVVIMHIDQKLWLG